MEKFATLPDSIEVTNYRCFRDSGGIELGRISYLLGENSSGKTSIVNLFVMVATGKAPHASDFQDQELPIEVHLNFGSDKLRIVFEPNQTKPRYEELAYVVPDELKHLMNTANLKGKGATLLEFIQEKLQGSGFEYSQDVFDFCKELVKKQSDVPHALLTFCSERQLLVKGYAPLEKAPTLFQVVHVGATDSYEGGLHRIIKKEILSRIKDVPNSPLAKAIADVQVEVDSLQRALDGNEIASEWANATKASILEYTEAIRLNIGDFLKIEGLTVDLGLSPLQVEFDCLNVTREGVKQRLDQHGDGIKRAIAISAVATASTENSNTLVIIEEPENFLHPPAWEELLEKLTPTDGSKLLVTTHSPLVIRPLEADAAFNLLKHRSGNSTTHGLKFTQNRATLFRLQQFKIINAALFAEVVVLVEGDTEAAFLPRVGAELFPVVESRRVAFLPLGGKTNLPDFRTLFQTFDKQVVAILDRDALLNCKLGVHGLDRERDAGMEAVKKEVALRNANPKTHVKIDSELWEKVKSHQFTATDLENVEVYPKNQWSCSGVLKDSTFQHEDLTTLITRLREQDIFLLERGEIESYFPDGVERKKLPGGIDAADSISGGCSARYVDELTVIFERVRELLEGGQ